MTLHPSYEELAQTQGQILAKLLFERHLRPESMLHCDAWLFPLILRVGFWTFTFFVQAHMAKALKSLQDRGLKRHRCPCIQVVTRMGRLRLESPYLYNRDTKQGARPLKDIFGFYGNCSTPKVQEVLADFGAHDAFALAQERFKRHYHEDVGDSAPRTLTLNSAHAAVEFLDHKLAQMQRSYELAPAHRLTVAQDLLVQADGCMLRTGQTMTAKEALAWAHAQDLHPKELARLEEAAAQGKTRLRPQAWREVHSGLTRQKEQREPSVLARRCSRDEFIAQLFQLGCSHGLAFQTTVLAIGDGGGGLKEGFEEHFAHISYLLDWRHLEEEHLQETAVKLGISDKTLSKRWARVRMERIAKGEAQAVLADLQSSYFKRQDEESEASEGTERLGRLVKYMEKFIYCMDYDKWREEGWPIASSEVESLHKRLTQKRMKLNGACWREDNLDPMLALRTVSINPGWWEEFWRWKHRRDAQARKTQTAA